MKDSDRAMLHFLVMSFWQTKTILVPVKLQKVFASDMEIR